MPEETPPVNYEVPKTGGDKPEPDFSSQEPETPPATGGHPELAITKPAQTKSKKKLILIIVAVVLVLAGAAAAAYFFYFKKDAPQAATSTVSQESTAPEATEPTEPQESEELKRFITPTTGEKWLAEPKKVGDLGYLNPELGERSVEYYEVGERNGKTIYISVEQVLGERIDLYEKSSDGTVTVLVRPDGKAVYNEDDENWQKDNFAPNIKIDKTTYYDSLTIPQDGLDIGNDYMVTRPSYPTLGDLVRPESDAAGTYTDIETYGDSKLQRYEYKYPDTSLTSQGYSIILPTGTRVGLDHVPLETSLDQYKWSAGDSYIDDDIAAISRGCGSRLAAITIADTVKDADTVKVGQSPSGKNVYHLASADHPIITKAYEELMEYQEGIEDIDYKNISKEDFIKAHGVLLHKDNAGQWLVYAREKLRPAFGCAKPVVYLYPETAQNVTVSVGADVKISEPFYNPLFGWSAFASPDGTLNVGGQIYDSLFWEGPGWGEYPIVNKGVVVKTSDALETIRKQMAQQGLNEKETADFIEYWKPNLPDKPYIRLTWLNTQQLDKLAPLKISPKPDTVIRVFLDFAGLDEPIDIEPQELSSIPRNGFTVTEWGGLSTKKLY